MHALAYWSLLAALFVSLFSAFIACFQAFFDHEEYRPWIEKGHYVATLLYSLCSGLLFVALANRDYSLMYVYEYTDNFLPQFYAFTAFWAGQEGSLLFWAWMVALAAMVFPTTDAYENLPSRTRTYYWIFFLLVQSFFLLLLTNWSNPFTEVTNPPADGRGMNPLLRNPGMIFHPPLLFLGYAGYTIPACLALASRLAGDNRTWLPASRNWVIFSWIFLTAGIVLGAWWSYMELGWGGYWAWDPVENASLIPWLTGTAFIHTAIIEQRRKSLGGWNVFLISLTLLLCFFGTYLVRSGVIDSLHAFGGGGVATPLLSFILAGLALSIVVVFVGKAPESRSLDELVSRPGMLVITAWLFMALGLVVLLGTMWPVITTLWSPNPVGLDADFYNRVCLPLFALMSVILVACPWLGWKGGLRPGKYALPAMGAFPVAAVGFYFGGITHPVALVAAASSAACLVGLGILMVTEKSMQKRRQSWGFFGVHIGLALCVLGVAFSGPYQVAVEKVVQQGESFVIDDYEFTFHNVNVEEGPAMAVAEAFVSVRKDGKALGELRPQRRVYRNFDQPFAEVSVIPGLGDELYSVLMGFEENGPASLNISINPLINWIWIGSTLMCLAAFLCLGGGIRRENG